MMKEFTTTDRCDRCGSQAYHAATKNNQELLFCAHHMNIHRHQLMWTEWEVETDVTGLEQIGLPQAVR